MLVSLSHGKLCLISLCATDHDYDGAIIITASHLPYNRNGFKFFTKEGGFDKKDITYVLESAAHMHTAADAPLVLGGDDLKYTDSAWVLAAALQVDGSRKKDVSKPSLCCVACTELAVAGKQLVLQRCRP